MIQGGAIQYQEQFKKQEVSWDIGNKLKELRVLKGSDTEELADRSELSRDLSPSWSAT